MIGSKRTLLVASILAVAIFLGGSQRSHGQCGSTATFKNVACCDGTFKLQTIPAGDGTRWTDGSTFCGFDGFDNPCSLPAVQSCPPGGGAKVANENTPVLAHQKLRVPQKDALKELAAFVPMCALNRSRHPKLDLPQVLRAREIADVRRNISSQGQR